ncbi:cytochrome c oxidase assembly protein [Alkalilimnicola ehrlichii]|uniref:cytochrome c oxidase assembly protein n=1 Tax=Alkalilimnicola ehrlichii TaxID=351052 RepID=UPI000E2E9298|nr:cytochrome c oxidase assembly protein [Alkalilimnicola ehrlichii]RFA31184.1 cytochrome c oxidase assembly protein [Alkalilimnicola ehrlichii]
MSENREQPKRHGRTVGKLLAVAFGMFAFGFALVPLYQVICEVTGLNGFVSNRIVNEPMPEVDKSRTVTVEFLANVGGGANWEFRPTVRTMEVHPGEIYTTSYYARNPAGDAAAAQASYSVAPGNAARYFGKPDCFCFTRQEFDAGEGRDMPVTFFVSPNLPANVNRVTLAYTFHELAN